MDTITQAMLGAVIGEAGFRRSLGGRAVVFGAVCALLPDFDVVTRVAGPWAGLVHHRADTHSLIILSIMAPVIGWIGWRLARKRGSPDTWAHLAFWALVTHPLLDWCTTYGTQLLAPFTRHRFSIDAVAIIDPVYSGILAAAVLCAATRRVPRRFSRGFAICALALSTAYLSLGFALGRRAENIATAQLEAVGTRCSVVRATPTMFNVLLWHVIAKEEEGPVQVGFLSLWHPTKIAWRRMPGTDHPLARKALRSKEGRILRWFSKDLLSAVVRPTAEGRVVLFTDHRIGFPPHLGVSPFGAQAHFDQHGRLLLFARRHRPRRFSPAVVLASIWRSVWHGPDPLASLKRTPAE